MMKIRIHPRRLGNFARLIRIATMDPNGGKSKALVNRYSKEELTRHIADEPFARRVVSFYRYVYLSDPRALRDVLFSEWDALAIKGRIYLAEEGINAQMSVPEPAWDAFVQSLYAHPAFKDVPFKRAVTDDRFAFLKLIVKVRHQIVADGLATGEYDVTNVGTHLDAAAWNEAVEKASPIIVDMRNFYESEVGHFEGAILPEAETFREELPMVLDKLKGHEDEKILLYCTGGIRCEKTSSYLKHHGFKDVNQLHGGIIAYAHQVQEQGLPNHFHGKNFVFDNRLGESISPEVIAHCHQCGQPSDRHINCANKACNSLFIQCESCGERMEHTCSDTCHTYIHLPEAEQIQWRREGRIQTHRFKRAQAPSKPTTA
jgi:UPF0176 protein